MCSLMTIMLERPDWSEFRVANAKAKNAVTCEQKLAIFYIYYVILLTY